MKLWGLELINFIGVYNGMGLNKIYIDFSKCRNKITVIKGDNGSGKSTIFKALNPFSDPSSSLLPDQNASKYIAYALPDGSILHIRYLYKMADHTGVRKTSCKVEREISPGNRVLLNPNGNVKEAKDIICDLLDIDSGFMTLAQLSSDDRGLADKTPAERKKFINAKISELDAYNDIYKKIVKKSTELNSVLTSLSTKIQTIGDIKSVESNVNALTDRLGNAEDEKISLVVKLSEYGVKYDTLSDKANEVLKQKSDLDKINKSISELNIDTPVSEKDVSLWKSNSDKYKYYMESLTSKIESINIEKSKISEKITAKQIKLDSIGNTSNLNDIKEQLDELYKAKAITDKRFKDLGFDKYESVTTSEYDYAIKTICRIDSLFNELRNVYDINIFMYYKNEIMSGKQGKKYTNTELNSYKDKLNNLNSILNDNEKLLQKSSSYSSIPKNCNNITTCPFIKDIVIAKNNLIDQDKLDKLDQEKHDLIKIIKKYEIDLKEYEEVLDAMPLINEYIHLIDSAQSIITKFPIKPMTNEDSINSLIFGNGGINIDLTPYIESQNLFTDSKSYKEDIDRLEKQYTELSPNAGLVSQLQEDIVSLQKEYNSYNNSLADIESMYDSTSESYEMAQTNLEITEALLIKTRQLNELQVQRNSLLELIKQGEDTFLQATDLSRTMDETKQKLDKIVSGEMPELQNLINKNKYKIVLYNDYIKEYNKYSKEYSKIETIKKYCSPTTGIQTIFMEIYMNKVIGISNQLLSMLFRGEYVLQPFIVNEKEFRMPVLGSGILNDDISSMSTSQVCMISMILSFSLLHQSSSIYNIIKIDELEGGLDTQNRLAFFDVLNNLMIQLNYEQCIMISHNTELNMNSMDVIILKNTDPASSFEGNIIFQI